QNAAECHRDMRGQFSIGGRLSPEILTLRYVHGATDAEIPKSMVLLEKRHETRENEIQQNSDYLPGGERRMGFKNTRTPASICLKLLGIDTIMSPVFH